jgi:hypothetical protein
MNPKIAFCWMTCRSSGRNPCTLSQTRVVVSGEEAVMYITSGSAWLSFG